MMNTIKLWSRIVLLWVILLCAACQSEQLPDEGGKPLNPEDCAVVGLGNITLDDASDTNVRAAVTTKLEDGKTFRLYAMRRGVTDASGIITSYTYTMKNGVPVMDDGQGDGKLYLPYGDLDVYLAGPVSIDSEETEGTGDDIHFVQLPVASPSGIIPRQGVDLIASCTKVTIKTTGQNSLNPVPLKHKMAKVKLKVKLKENDPVMTKLVLTKVELYNQHSGTGEYVFSNKDGGSITPLPADSVSGISVVGEGGDIQTASEGKEYYTTFMLLPRKAGYLKTEIEMDITTNMGKNPYRMSGIIKDVELIGGKQNLLYTEPIVSADVLWRPTLLPWNEEEPLTPAMGGDMIVYLDGRDAPEMINGKLCWRDRSGNGNHAEILSSDIVYNQERMCYEFPAAKDKMLLPDLGYIPDYTLEVTAEAVQDAGSLVSFTGEGGDSERCLFVHLFYTAYSATYFDSGNYSNAGGGTTAGGNGLGRIYMPLSTDPMFYHTFRTYSFKKSSTAKNMTMGFNGTQSYSASATSKHGSFTTNYIGGKKQLKIRSLRLYRKVLSTAELSQNYQVDNSIYKQDPEIVKNGLLLNLDGKVGPYTASNGYVYWPDLSGNGNHARYVYRKGATLNRTTSGLITYTGRGYRFNNLNGSDCSFMELIKTLGKRNNFTLELVVASENQRATAFHSGPDLGLAQNRGIGIHLPFEPGAGFTSQRIIFDGPRLNDGKNDQQNRITYTGPYVSVSFTSKVHYYAFTRNYSTKKNAIVVDGQEIGSLNNSSPDLSGSLPEMTYSYIGNLVSGSGSSGMLTAPVSAPYTDTFIGEFYAIRLYDRALTETEILQNSRADKMRYKY